MSYSSMNELHGEFSRKSRPGFLSSFRSAAKHVALSLTAVLALTAAAGSIGYSRLETAHEQEIVAAERPDIEPKWNAAIATEFGEKVGIGNDVIQMTTTVYNEDVSKRTGGRSPRYPADTQVIYAEPGDKLRVSVLARQLPHDELGEGKVPTFPGSVYIEGYEPVHFNMLPSQYDYSTRFNHYSAGIGQKYLELILDEEMEDGVYTLASELYTLTQEEYDSQRSAWSGADIQDIDMPEKSLVMNRETVTVVVGDEETPLALQRALFKGESHQVAFYNPAHRLGEVEDESLTYFLTVPGIEHKVTKKEGNWGNPWVPINLPSLKDEFPEIMSVGAMRGEDPVWTGYLPIERECRYCEPVEDIERQLRKDQGTYSRGVNYATKGFFQEKAERIRREKGIFAWGLRIPEREFSQELIGLREEVALYLNAEEVSR